MPMIMLLTSILIVDYVRIRVTAKPDTTEGRTDRLYSIFEQALYNCLLQPPMNMIMNWIVGFGLTSAKTGYDTQKLYSTI